MPKPSIFDRYETYDPKTEGYGNADQWRQTFQKVIGKLPSIDEARQTLGISSNTPIDEIKKVYRKLAKEFHPDKSPDKIAAFRKINEAYKIVIGEKTFVITASAPTVKQPTTIMPQLLKEIYESEVEKYLTDPRYCAQEKHNGRRRLIRFKDSSAVNINKLGMIVDEHSMFENACRDVAEISGKFEFILDGEEVGDIYHVFDILVLGKEDLRSKTYEQRWRNNFLNSIKMKSIQPVYTAYTEQEKRDLFNKLKSNNREGIVFKLLSGLHKVGYSDDQLKFKFYTTASVIVIRHNVKNSVGIAVQRSGQLVPIGNVTMIGHDRPPIGTIVEVKYLYIVRGGSLYQPSFVEVRDDVRAEDCTMEKLKFKPED